MNLWTKKVVLTVGAAVAAFFLDPRARRREPSSEVGICVEDEAGNVACGGTKPLESWPEVWYDLLIGGD